MIEENQFTVSINPLAARDSDYYDQLIKREAMAQGDSGVSAVISGAINALTDFHKNKVAGLLSKAELQTLTNETLNQMLAKIYTINQNTAYVLERKLADKSNAQVLQILESYSGGNPVTNILSDLTRATARDIRLSNYKSEINKYIEQSKRLIDELPAKMKKIINDLKDVQSSKYKELKAIGANKIINNKLTEIAYDKLQRFGDMGFGDLYNKAAGADVPIADTRYFYLSGWPRAFFVKLPSILQGIPHDICIFSAEKHIDNSFTCGTRYMKITQLGKRMYNFKYKAWWGPMVRFFSDVDKFASENKTVIIVLRILKSSEAVYSALKMGAAITTYGFDKASHYRAYMTKLAEVRTQNFKVKRTAQRFMRNNMAKFLNTDKQIIQEIGQYTNIAVK